MGPDSKADDGVALLEMEDKSCLPEMCSLDCSLITTVWGDLSFIYRWEREWLLKNAKRMMELGIKPECEVFNPSSIEDVVNVLVPGGVLADPVSLTFVMGMNRVSQGAISFSLLPKDRPVNWSTMAIGSHQLQGVTYGLLKGGSVRVGLEDNIYYAYGELAKSNAQLVERMVRIIHELEMDVATPDEAREMLGLRPRK
jgi:3-keto-5-aminohexanoate cleavage enzyme